MTKSVVDYGDYYPMSTMWFKTNKRDYSDVLCRIAAFQLTQDNIQTQNLTEREQWQCYSDTQWLYSDWDAISNFPIIDFSEDEVEKYFTLFNPITITPNCSSDEMYLTIQEKWKNKGI